MDRRYRQSPHPPPGFNPQESYERRRSPSPRRFTTTTTEEIIDHRGPPSFLEEDRIRREQRETRGALVRREPEPSRGRSPSPVRRGILRRVQSVSPRRHEMEERLHRQDMLERSSRGRSRSRSPSMDSRLRSRFDDRRSMDGRERERVETRIVERETRFPRSPESDRSDSMSPPPVVRGPVIERDVITHYHDIDHGVTQAPPFNHVRRHSVSRERRPRFSSEVDLISDHYDELRVSESRVEDRHVHTERRAHSAAPPMSAEDRAEADYITDRIDSRGRMGESHNGITKDWSIIDVPPGTERVRMDGAGGAGVDVDWTRYSGVRRTRFIPDRERDFGPEEEDDLVVRRTTMTMRTESPHPHPHHPPPRLEREREREVRIEKVTDRKVLRPPPPQPMPLPPRNPDMWTEITKDLVCREAIEALGYHYEETQWHFYVMQYLQYDDVLELIQLSDDLRRRRRDRAAALDRVGRWEREHKIRPVRGMGFEDERVVEREREREKRVLVDRNIRFR